MTNSRKLLLRLTPYATVALVCSVAFSVSAATTCPYVWQKNLKVGSTGPDVLSLQQFLNTSADTQIAGSGAGSPGKETASFGGLTKHAVVAFQEKYAADILTPNGLSVGTGLVGAATRAKLNALCSAAAPSPAPQAATEASSTAPDTLTVSDPGQPASSLAPAGSGTLFLSFTLNAGDKDVVVKGVTVQRTGLGSDAAFSSVALFDDQGLEIGPVHPFNSNHQVLFATPFTIPAHESHRFDVYGNMQLDLSPYDGQYPAIQLVGIDASSPVSGTLPLRGSLQSVNNSLVVGGATALRSSFDPGTDITRYIGDTGVNFAGIRITANSQEDILLYSMVWTQSGSVGSDDLANIMTVVSGTTTTAYPTFISPYTSKEYVTIFDQPIRIAKGDSLDVYVRGDIMTSAAGRTVEFDINDNTDDVSLAGATYGFGVGVGPSGNSDVAGAHSAFITDTGDPDGITGTPFYAGPIVTVLGASITSIGKSSQ
jgi:hypothetical protein